jgi:small subunit ribosomal protein S1
MLGGSRGLLAAFEPGQVRVGVVKNVAAFGAFVDLGGIDGLLHVTDMAWHRVSSPHEVVHLDQQLEVYVLSVDRQRVKVALSLKHLTPSPWAGVAERYPVGSRHRGQVVGVMSYGAFVRFGPGFEGLVHLSEMSWTRRISHPAELVALGDWVEVQVLNINGDRQEISLGMKQAQLDRAWRTSAVVGIARSIAEERRGEWLPILADALEEAGCADNDLLSHLRGPAAPAWGGALIDSLLAQP